MFEEEMTGMLNENTPSSLLKSLISPKDIAIKTELNMKQIKTLLELGWHKDMLKNMDEEDPFNVLMEQIDENLLTYLVSYKRQGRLEIIDGVKAVAQSFVDGTQTLISNMASKK